MTTHTDYVDGTYKNPAAVLKDYARFEVWKAKIDFGYLAGIAADVIQAITIPAGTFVYNAWLQVENVCTANANVDLGYGSDSDYWGAAMPVDATGIVTHRKFETGGGIIERSHLANVPLYFATADTIDIVPTKNDNGVASIAAGVIYVCALLIRKV